MGLKMLPPGLHFVHFSLVKAGSVAPRCGFYHYFNAGDVLVTRWNAQAEDIDILGQNTEQVDRLKAAFTSGQLDTQLGMFTYITSPLVTLFIF